MADTPNAPRPASRADEVTDLTPLIEAIRDRDGYWYDCDDEDMEPILLALRLLRVMRHPRALNVYFDSGCYWVRFKPRSTAEGTPGHPLDDAERIFGITDDGGE